MLLGGEDRPRLSACVSMINLLVTDRFWEDAPDGSAARNCFHGNSWLVRSLGRASAWTMRLVGPGPARCSPGALSQPPTVGSTRQVHVSFNIDRTAAPAFAVKRNELPALIIDEEMLEIIYMVGRLRL